MSHIFRTTKHQKQEAKKRLTSLNLERGNDEAYYKELRQTYDCFSDTRHNANQTKG